MRLSRLFGNSARFWMNLQRETDLAEARERLRPELVKVRPMSDTGWGMSHSADSEDWAQAMSRTRPADLLAAALADHVATPLPAAEFPGITPERLSALATGTSRFTCDDDAALCSAFGLAPGYWLRAQAIADAAAGIAASLPELSTTERIRDALCRIEVAEDVRILYAVESGSRAWGFASADSDYDVRFIYAHRPEFYISAWRRRDVIDPPIEHDLDLSGWDLPKALGLFGKSNPPLLEWLRSPIVYVETGSLRDRLREQADAGAPPTACLYHYLHMAEGNFREYLQGEQVWLKKYFYVLRPVLACRWIEARGTFPPVEFNDLVEAVLPNQLRSDVDKLITRKLAGEELRLGPTIPSTNRFLAEEMARLRMVARDNAGAQTHEPSALDALLHEILHETWVTPC